MRYILNTDVWWFSLFQSNYFDHDTVQKAIKTSRGNVVACHNAAAPSNEKHSSHKWVYNAAFTEWTSHHVVKLLHVLMDKYCICTAHKERSCLRDTHSTIQLAACGAATFSFPLGLRFPQDHITLNCVCVFSSKSNFRRNLKLQYLIFNQIFKHIDLKQRWQSLTNLLHLV